MYNGLGMGGAGGMGGQEMMMISCCCVVCICIAVVLMGYFTNVFCGMGFGKSCEPEETTPPPFEDVPIDTSPPVFAPSVQTCSKVVAPIKRAANDPRPEIQAKACEGVERVTGRDCYFWTVQPDKHTNLASWVRVNSGEFDMYDPTCTPNMKVKCASKINFDDPEMALYREDSAQKLFEVGKCKPFVRTDTENKTVKAITALASKVVARTTGRGTWSTSKSKMLYDGVERYIGQNDLTVTLKNVETAVKFLQNPNQFSDKSIPMHALCYMVEAACRTLNEPDWINNMAKQMGLAGHRSRWQTKTLPNRWEYFVDELVRMMGKKQPGRPMVSWKTRIYSF